MYGSRTVTRLVLIFGDVINWILKPYIQTYNLVYLALDVSTTYNLTSKVHKMNSDQSYVVV